MPGLSQGLLADNSVTPDVEIEKCDNSSSRTQLKSAADNKSLSAEKIYPNDVKNQPFSKVIRMAQPAIPEKLQNTSKTKESLSDNFLAYEVAKLSNKLDDFEKMSQLQERNQAEKRTHELEQKLSEITDKRLHYLEKLQQDQEQWKAQYLHTLQKLHETNSNAQMHQKFSEMNTLSRQQVGPNTDCTQKQSLLKTPLPRKNIPQPTSSVQLSNGQFLRDILDQYNASTPNLTHNQQHEPVDTIPTKLSYHQAITKDNLYCGNAGAIISPIKPRSSQLIAEEIEQDVERQKISEKFPGSFSDYLLHAKVSPVSRVCVKAVPQSSLVADFRTKLRKLTELRTTLENNFLAVQRKPKLDDFAIAALAEQITKDEWQNIDVDRLEMCWVQKLVDEQIAVSSSKVESEFVPHVKSKKSLNEIPQRRLKPSTSKTKPPYLPKQKTKVVKDLNDSNTEDVLTHVYGKAEYHPHRSTVHEPFMHISPMKSPTFRSKRALQSVPARHVRSEKTQTISRFSSPTILKSKYLAPTALSLRPPQIHENDPDPVVISAAAPVTIIPKQSPKKSPVKPELPEVKIEIFPDDIPGNATSFESSIEEDLPSTADEVHLKGEGKCHKPPRKESYPPIPPKPSPKCVLGDDEIDQISSEDKIKCWVEQEIMARILGQLYPTSANQETQTLNMQTDAIKRIIEDEIRSQIHQRMMPEPKENKPEELNPFILEVKTPLSTPRSTPIQSVSEETPVFQHHSVKTPSLSPSTSVIESESSVSEIPIPPRVVTPPVEVVEVTIVATPQATPPPSIPSETPKEVSFAETVKEYAASTHSTLPDPWEGKDPEENIHLVQQLYEKQRQTAPEPDPSELVVRPVTPPPAPRKILYSSTSESSSSEDTFNTQDKTISEGQLVIEHGEMLPKKHQPFQIPDNLEDYINQNTLADAADFDPISEGEFRPTTRSLHPKRKANYVDDDPTGVYARPRHPANTSDPEDLSVGEIPGKKREKFYKWKSSRHSSKASPITHRKPAESVPSASDLNSTSIGSSSISEEIAPPSNVIMVTTATPRVVQSLEPNPANNSLDGTNPDMFVKDSLDDPLPRPRNQMTLTLPSHDALSGASDTEEISVQDL